MQELQGVSNSGDDVLEDIARNSCHETYKLPAHASKTLQPFAAMCKKKKRLIQRNYEQMQ